jgi:hypothetical protein
MIKVNLLAFLFMHGTLHHNRDNDDVQLVPKNKYTYVREDHMINITTNVD